MKKLIIQLICLCYCFSLYAITNTWNGGPGFWDDPTKWSRGSVPGVIDSAIITNNGYVILSSGTNAYAQHITIEDTLIVRKDANLTVANSLGVGLVNNGYFTNKGTVSFFNTADDAIYNSSKLINYAKGRITVSSTFKGIVNSLSGSIKNSGVIFVDDSPGYGYYQRRQCSK